MSLSLKCKITFTEPLLGTLAGDPEIAKEFILSKRPEGMSEDEVKALTNDEALAKACTVFPRDEDGKVFIWDYQWKGFFKEAFKAFNMGTIYTKDDLNKAGLRAYKKSTDLLIFVKPRMCVLKYEGELGWCERPLRGSTAQGERISLARSEEVPAGAKGEIEIVSMNKNLWPYIKAALDYGELKGMLQWRNSGKGRFVWEEIKGKK